MITQRVKETLKRTPLYPLIRVVRQVQASRQHVTPEQELRRWEKLGRPAPPPRIVKQRIVKDYAQNFSLRTLVETGTYLGEMIEATQDCFTHIVSIELDTRLAERATSLFASYSHIHIIHGDSSKELPAVLSQLTEPSLFWLDGHYSEGITTKGEVNTPILRELELILNHPVAGHVILIDDAREFTGQNDYPPLDQLRSFTMQKKPGYAFEVECDIIRLHDLPSKS